MHSPSKRGHPSRRNIRFSLHPRLDRTDHEVEGQSGDRHVVAVILAVEHALIPIEREEAIITVVGLDTCSQYNNAEETGEHV